MNKDKRIYPRSELGWPISAITADGRIQGETKNISLNGAFICCEKALCPHDMLLLTIGSPSGAMQVIAQVVWSNICACVEEKSQVGMGVKFLWSLPKKKPESDLWREAV